MINSDVTLHRTQTGIVFSLPPLVWHIRGQTDRDVINAEVLTVTQTARAVTAEAMSKLIRKSTHKSCRCVRVCVKGAGSLTCDRAPLLR